MPKAKWKRFEDLAASIQRDLAPGATVNQNERIRGRRTGVLREVDIAVRQHIAQYDLLIAIECKDYQRKVNVKDVEGFIGLADDVGANQAAMVAARGFTETAKTRAAHAGIRLFRLVDAEAHDWQSYISMPAIADLRQIKSFSLRFSTTGQFRLAAQDFQAMSLYRQDGSLIGVVGNLILDRWEADAIPEDPGVHAEIPLTDEPTYINTDGDLYLMNVHAKVLVERKLYFGHLPVVEFKGFSDEISGGVITTGFTTGNISVEEVEQNWRHIESEDELAVEPTVTFTARVTLERPLVADLE